MHLICNTSSSSVPRVCSEPASGLLLLTLLRRLESRTLGVDGNGPVCATRAHYNADADMCAHHHSARRQGAMECSGAPPRWPRFPRYSAGLYRASDARGALVGTGLHRHTPCTDVVPHQYRTSCGTVARELDGRRQTGRDNAAQRDLWGAFGRY